MKLETFDVPGTALAVSIEDALAPGSPIPRAFRAAPRLSLFDAAIALPALILMALVGALLMVLNPLFNPGPLFFCQTRMGQGGRRFRMWKFRTMAPSPCGLRGYDEPLEVERITTLGRILRRTRLDELPNFLNVLMGEMRVIGPRPDAWEHALIYSSTVRGYAQRFSVRPGITGLAQVCGGYADTHRAVERKARFDRFYVRRASVALDVFIVFRTIRVLLTGFGAK